ncbi:hypothetical protein Tco_1014352 [Tanacetum coccineum]
MDNPNITMEEYIRLEEEKARRRGKVYNWETAKYGKIWYDEDVHDLRSVETKFPAIVFNDELSSEKTLSCEPTVSYLNNNEIDFRVSFDESADEDYIVTFDKNSFSYKIISVNDLKTDSENDNEKVNMPSFPSPEPKRHQYLRFKGLQYTDTDIADFEERLGRIYDREGHSVFTSRSWRRLFEIRGPLVHELILEFLSTFRFGEAVLDLDIAGALQFQLGEVRRRMSWREFILGISFAIDFLSTALSYTSIRDLMLKLCHRLIACIITGRSQALEKVTVTDLFYLRGMDVGLVNIPYLLARYLRLLTSGRKRKAMISGDLPVIEMAKLVRLQICVELDDTWAWVALGPERPACTMAQRLATVEEDVHEIRGALGEHREILDSMACDFSPFSTWTVVGLSQMTSQAGVRYTSYADFQIQYVRHTRRRTNDASTSTAQQDEQQPDP